MAGEMIYLDNNATTPLDPAVVAAMLPFLTESYGNPSSGHRFGREARHAIDLARKRVAALLDCEPSEIVFTSGGTESSNAALNSALQFDPSRKQIITSAVEHSAVRRHCQAWQKQGSNVIFLGVDTDGNLDLEELENAIGPETAIVSIMSANNETGVLFPIERIAEICRAKGVLLHTDAVQAVGKMLIHLRNSGINFLSLSAHKFYGPKGVGALYIKKGTPFRPSIIGGGQENSQRAGTENVASIVGMGKAAECSAGSLGEEETKVRPMRDSFEETIAQEVADVTINGQRSARLPNTSNLSFSGIEAQSALILLDQLGICCSAGSACRSGSTDASHVLNAMRLPEDRLRGSLRFSFGRFNSDQDLIKAIESVPAVVKKLRQLSKPAPKTPVALQH
jgi:cysteine desulfurase